jgi:hypothetical protein
MPFCTLEIHGYSKRQCCLNDPSHLLPLAKELVLGPFLGRGEN